MHDAIAKGGAGNTDHARELSVARPGSADRPAVYTWEPNSNAGKPLFALTEKGVAFDHIYIDLLEFEQHAPEYLAINPMGTVPALIHRGRIFAESTPMCEYIDGAFEGPSLRPEDALARYDMRTWCRRTDVVAESISVLGWHMFMGPMVRQKSPEELERLIARIPTKERQISWRTAAMARFTDEQLSAARARIGAYIQSMNQTLSDAPWLVGDQFTLADILTFANFYAVTKQVPEHASDEQAPHFMRWLRDIYARPATMKTFALAQGRARRAFDIAAELGVAA